jgi:hypothetical protein
MGIVDHVNVIINGPSEGFSSQDADIAYNSYPFFVCVEPTSFVVDEGDSFEFDIFIYRNFVEESDAAVIAHVLPTVTYAVTGTATNGTDYTLLDGSVPFNQNETFYDAASNRRGHTYTVEVDVFDDVPVDDLETIVITINISDNYVVGDPSGVTDNSTPGTFTTVINDMSTPTYATLNPSDKHSTITLSNGNLTATGDTSSGGATRLVRANMSESSGKWYYEATITGVGAGVGVGNNSTLMNTEGDPNGGGGHRDIVHAYDGDLSSVFGYADQGSDGSSNIYNGPALSNQSQTTIGVLLDFDGNTIRFTRADTNAVISSSYTLTDGRETHPLVTIRSFFAGAITVNFGASAFVGTPPSGYHIGFGLNVPVQP